MPKAKPAEFNSLSQRFNKELAKDVRLAEGIFFTPQNVRTQLWGSIAPLLAQKPPARILEPSFGSGEFLIDAAGLYPEAEIFGVEKNTKLFTAFGGNEKAEGMNLFNEDFLQWSSVNKGAKFDLIVGNPPYFVMGHSDIPADIPYGEAMIGRPNIYILFLYLCLTRHLAEGGFLAFIIPTSLYNTAYYEPMRSLLLKNSIVHTVKDIEAPGFHEAAIEVCLLVVQKKTGLGPMNQDNWFFYRHGENLFMSPYASRIRELLDGSTSLMALGLTVKTGSVVWNQVKDKLADDATAQGARLLVYSSNMGDTGLEIGKPLGGQKKQYVRGLTKMPLTGPVILIERGYGHGSSFRAHLVELDDPWYAENHLNVISASPNDPQGKEKLERVVASFKDPRTQEFLDLFAANGMLSASNLSDLLPIY